MSESTRRTEQLNWEEEEEDDQEELWPWGQRNPETLDASQGGDRDDDVDDDDEVEIVYPTHPREPSGTSPPTKVPRKQQSALHDDEVMQEALLNSLIGKKYLTVQEKLTLLDEMNEANFLSNFTQREAMEEVRSFIRNPFPRSRTRSSEAAVRVLRVCNLLMQEKEDGDKKKRFSTVAQKFIDLLLDMENDILCQSQVSSRQANIVAGPQWKKVDGQPSIKYDANLRPTADARQCAYCLHDSIIMTESNEARAAKQQESDRKHAEDMQAYTRVMSIRGKKGKTQRGKRPKSAPKKQTHPVFLACACRTAHCLNQVITLCLNIHFNFIVHITHTTMVSYRLMVDSVITVASSPPSGSTSLALDIVKCVSVLAMQDTAFTIYLGSSLLER